jgi:hypothetical protein
VRILRIDETEMKIGLSGVDEAGQPLPAAAPSEAAAEPVSVEAAEAAPTGTPEVATEAAGEEPAPKKRRTRKKAEEPPSKPESES